MQEYAPLYLKSQADRRIKKGHLWVYSNEVDNGKTPLKGFQSGQLVEVLSVGGQSLGLAFVNPNALICGRVVSRDSKINIAHKFLKKRLQAALRLREQVFPQPFYRLVYGDSDLLPGVVVDRFGDYLVVQISVEGFDLILDELISALNTVVKPKGIIVRNNHAARELEQLEEKVVTFGEVPQSTVIEENDCQFEIPLFSGQKTGWFYDHRVNRRFLQTLVRGRTVLDVFSYLGAWGLQAGKAGASRVTCVDSSGPAIDQLLNNCKLNGLSDKVDAIQGRAVEVLKALLENEQQFDVVVLDPPAFVKKRKDMKSGTAAYRHLIFGSCAAGFCLLLNANNQ